MAAKYTIEDVLEEIMADSDSNDEDLGDESNVISSENDGADDV
jgi:hypothetical protein